MVQYRIWRLTAVLTAILILQVLIRELQLRYIILCKDWVVFVVLVHGGGDGGVFLWWLL